MGLSIGSLPRAFLRRRLIRLLDCRAAGTAEFCVVDQRRTAVFTEFRHRDALLFRVCCRYVYLYKIIITYFPQEYKCYFRRFAGPPDTRFSQYFPGFFHTKKGRAWDAPPLHEKQRKALCSQGLSGLYKAYSFAFFTRFSGRFSACYSPPSSPTASPPSAQSTVSVVPGAISSAMSLRASRVSTLDCRKRFKGLAP